MSSEEKLEQMFTRLAERLQAFLGAQGVVR